MEEIIEKDQNGNITYYRTSDGVEAWHEYDERGNCTHYRNSRGVEYWYIYDEDGRFTIHTTKPEN